MDGTTGGEVSRQREVGAASRQRTRRRLLEAAGAEFAQSGYLNATVSKIAGRAGVTVQTLYLAWGSKRALLRAFMESTLTTDAGGPGVLGDRFAGRTPHEVIAQTAALVSEIATRSATGWKLYRDAAASDAEIADDWAEFQRRRRETFERIVDNIPVRALRAGLTRESARDTAWAIASPETHEVLVRHAGYSPEEFEQWVAATMAAALLAEPPPAP
jgi:AcrR family transcriptional regulator